MPLFKIVETDNFGGDYPDEKFVNLPLMSQEQAEFVADAINRVCSGSQARRHWLVKPADYQLQPGFEP